MDTRRATEGTGQQADTSRGVVETTSRMPDRAHLEGCRDCARLLEALHRLGANVEVPEPGPGYWDTFNRRVEDRIERQADPGRVLSHPRRDWLRQQSRYLIPAAAAAVLVVWIVRFGGMGIYSPRSPQTRPVVEKTEPAPGLPVGVPAEKRPEPARTPAARPSSRPAPTGQPEAAPERKTAVGAAHVPYRVSPPPSASAEGEKEISSETRMAAEPSARTPESSSASTGGAMPTTAARVRSTADRSEEGVRLGAAEDRRAEPLHQGAGKPEAAGSPSCDEARRLAADGRFRDAEAAERDCLARDASPRTQENGLVFLAELLDRQARFTEADAVIEEVRDRFPDSRALDLYRRQRPQVQSGDLPFSAAPR